MLPAHQEFPNDGELGRWKTFCENICLLFQGIYVLGDDPFVLSNMRTEKVIFKRKVLVASGHLGSIDDGEATLIVFEDSGSNHAISDGGKIHFGPNFLDEGPHGKKLPRVVPVLRGALGYVIVTFRAALGVSRDSAAVAIRPE